MKKIVEYRKKGKKPPTTQRRRQEDRDVGPDCSRGRGGSWNLRKGKKKKKKGANPAKE